MPTASPAWHRAMSQNPEGWTFYWLLGGAPGPWAQPPHESPEQLGRSLQTPRGGLPARPPAPPREGKHQLSGLLKSLRMGLWLPVKFRLGSNTCSIWPGCWSRNPASLGPFSFLYNDDTDIQRVRATGGSCFLLPSYRWAKSREGSGLRSYSSQAGGLGLEHCVVLCPPHVTLGPRCVLQTQYS